MRLLLDTHILIWLAEGHEDLPSGSRKLIDQAAAEDGLTVSAISFWEAAMLSVKKRITLSLPLSVWRARVIDSGITETPITGEIGVEAVSLPGTLHQDPADRLIVATARLNGWQLATRDDRLLRYADAGYVDALRA